MDFYSNNSTNIDLREELHSILFGSLDLTPQGKQVLIRRLTNTPCKGCFSTLTGGPTSPYCPYCDGEGWEFTEDVQMMFMTRGAAPIYKPGSLATGAPLQSDYGYTDPNKATCWCEFNVFPDYERYTIPTHESFDKLYELKVDADGNTITPIIKTSKWKILTLDPFFGDYGRVEYIELGLEKQNS